MNQVNLFTIIHNKILWYKSIYKHLNLSIIDEVSESYWKELAEERRKALNESLHENEQVWLHQAN